MLDVEFAQVTDPGRAREHNEDYVGYSAPDNPARARTHGWLFALADGVGGQDLGEVASRTAIEAILDGFQRAPAGESLSVLVPKLVQGANIKVFETGMSARPGGVSMSTTLVACGLRFDRAVVAHVGDSRCYLIRHGHVSALTRDHTLVNEQARLGIISSSEAARAVHRNVLSRSLGSNLFVSVETDTHQVHAGDTLLLCSDGLHGAISAEDILKVIASNLDLDTCASRLVEIANERDGGDNISVQLIRIRNVERIGMYRGRPYKLQ
jgi:protein phosphatase